MDLINRSDIPYSMLYKENWLKGTGFEAQAAWKSDIDKMPTVEAILISWFQAKAYSWEKDLKTACREDAESIRHIQDTYLGVIEEWRKEQ